MRYNDWNNIRYITPIYHTSLLLQKVYYSTFFCYHNVYLTTHAKQFDHRQRQKLIPTTVCRNIFSLRIHNRPWPVHLPYYNCLHRTVYIVTSNWPTWTIHKTSQIHSSKYYFYHTTLYYRKNYYSRITVHTSRNTKVIIGTT